MIYLLLTLILTLHLNANPEKFAISHVEGKGLGYSGGYTSFDLFLSQPLCSWTFIPFADLRGHLFNTGKCASNVGIGIRYLQESRETIWGINSFYDTLETGHRDYHQISMGLEVLTEDLGLHINAYFPISCPKISFSEGKEMKKKRIQFAMKGIDATLDYRCFNQQTFNVYVGLGPYFYWGKSAARNHYFNKAYGGKLNFGADIKDYACLDVKLTYDTAYKWGGQVLLSFEFSFDGTLNLCEESRCSDYLEEKLYQFVYRNEIITRKTKHKFKKKY